MSDYKPPQDEIPGLTTFLYQANRFREPHEYINHWKFEERSSERRQQLGIPADHSEDELLDRIQALQHKIDELDMTPELNRLNNEIEMLKVDLAQTRTLASDYKRKNDSLQMDKTSLSQALDEKKAAVNKFTEQLIKYGEHHADCNIVDALESGRMLDKSEKDACTCGWTSSKLQVLEVKQ